MAQESEEVKTAAEPSKAGIILMILTKNLGLRVRDLAFRV